jgi:uncharacterized protein DUF3108
MLARFVGGSAMSSRLALLAILMPTAAFAAGGAGGDAPEGPAAQLTMAMTLYAGGVTLGKVDMDATIRGDQYHVVSNLTTGGIVNAFWQAQIQATSNGKVAGSTFQPAFYDSYDTNHSGKKQQVSLTYEAGQIRLFADPKFPTSGYEVKPEQQKGTFDPISAVVYITSGAGAEAGNACAVTAPVFDGRRRYNIEMSKAKDIDIKMDNGVYRGKGLLCEMKYHQIAGFKPKIIKENESFPKINAWVATFPSGVAGRNFVVPLRVWAETQYGVVAAVVTSLKIDGQSPKS